MAGRNLQHFNAHGFTSLENNLMKNTDLLLKLLLGLSLGLAGNTKAADPMAESFQHPPASVRPWVYWFPLEGNITSNGITADLEAMKRVGIGGVLYMETDQGAPAGKASFAGPEWRKLFQHICGEAHRLGLEVNMNNDAGWCGSGGPWITPELSMQKIVWTVTDVTGPAKFDAVLTEPAKVAGYYGDIAVFAYPTPAEAFQISHISGKSALTQEDIFMHAEFPSAPAEATVQRGQILNLTTQLGAGGKLTWDVPPGKWRILRLGHTSTGVENHPAPAGGLGLESDKLSQAATEAQFNGLLAKLIADNRVLVGPGGALVSTHIDSWETGSQNWTPKFREDFQRLRGYDPLPLLPVITGQVVDSTEVSERFLRDVRMTVNELLLENYAGHFRELARQHGMRLSIEAYDGVPADDLTYGGCADEPMAEFWSWPKFGAAYSCTEMSSAAHVYGKRILGAESFTASDSEKWQGHPALIKDLGDWAFCEGINRFVFHRYALQPWTEPNRAPGVSMGPWGLHYERTETWWEQSKAWHEYLARCQYLLQQGLFVADLCFLAPETAPQRWKSPVKSGNDRPGYNFDGCPPQVVLQRMQVKDGRLVLPDGMSYRLLVLPQVETMTPPLLRKIRDLVKAGATVVGAPPVKSPSLEGFPECDVEVQALAREIWGSDPAPSSVTERRYGQGRVIWGGEFSPPRPKAVEGPSSLQVAKWIWRAGEGNAAQAVPPGNRYFRREFVIGDPAALESARLALTADNSFDCWLNGKPVSRGDDFNRVYTADAAPLLAPGTNVLAVAAVNADVSPNPAGLIATLTLKDRTGNVTKVATDSSWLAAEKVGNGWQTNAAADGWTAAMEIGPLGMGPWGDVGSGGDTEDPTPDIQLLCDLLRRQGVPPDFSFEAQAPADGLRYIHKRIGETEVYFVANKNPQPAQAVCAFRVAGRRPELWWPDTGRRERPAVYDEKDGLTHVPIHFDPSGSVFVLFRAGEKSENDRVIAVSPDAGDTLALRRTKDGIEAEGRAAGSFSLKLASGRTRELTLPAPPPPIEINGPWEVAFDSKSGGPAQPVTFAALEDWSKRSEEGIRYYSGTAVYRKTFLIPVGGAYDRAGGDQRFVLDLGKVAIMAEVKLNGKSLGILWKEPFRMDITEALKAGDNALEIKVVNLWINRQIGDEQLPEDSERNGDGTLKSWPEWVQQGKPSPTGRISFTSWRLWKRTDPLVASGLLGPVTVRTSKVVKLGK
jgi:hypothetical protein